MMESLAEIKATLVRTTTGGAGRRPTVMLAPELTTEQRRAVKVFELESVVSSSSFMYLGWPVISHESWEKRRDLRACLRRWG